MGYESKLYVVEKSSLSPDKYTKKCYAGIIAMFDVCKFCALSDKFRNAKETDCYFYADDGNTQILEDRCGKPLTELPLNSVIEILENLNDSEKEYRRFAPFLAMLKSFQAESKSWNDLAVLHYGY